MREASLLLIVSAAALLAAGEATVKRYIEKLATTPDFFQADKAYGQLPRNGAAYCGPTAVSNALMWLDGNGFGKLLPAANPGPREQFELIRKLGTPDYMKVHPVKGCGPTGMMNAIKRFSFERGYRTLVEYAGWRTRNYRVAEKPDVHWLLQSVRGPSSLIVNIGWYKTDPATRTHTRLGGHYITVVGYEAADHKTWLYIHDPAKRSSPRPRNSLTKCPVKCQLKPLPAGDMMKPEEDDAFSAEGYLLLDGIRLKKGADCAIIDGATAFSLLSN